MKKYVYLLFALFHIGCASADVVEKPVSSAPHKGVSFRMEKASVIPNRYYLFIVNDGRQAVSFNADNFSNVLTLENGKTVPVVARPLKVINQIDKGFVIRRGQEGTLQFDIPSNDMQQASAITFNGATMINRMTMLDYWVIDRELIVTYDVRAKEFSVEDGETITE